jgi:DNA polymerase I-like protein with 3'-5' exonuclease and polymerase domains
MATVACFDQLPLLTPASSWVAPTELPSLRGCRRIAVDVETCDPTLSDLGPGTRRGGYVCGWSLATDDGRKYYFPTRHQGGGNLDEGLVWRYARAELNAFDGIVVGANLIYDLDYFANYGVTFPLVKRFHDVQVAEPLLDENKLKYNLESLAVEYLGEGKNETLLAEAAAAYGAKTARQVKQLIWRLPAKYAGAYGEADADLPLRIMDKQIPLLEKEGLTSLFDLESRLIPILLAMRRRGVRVDVDGAGQVKEKLSAERAIAVAEMRRLAGPKAELMAVDSFSAALQERGLPVTLTAKTQKPSITKSWLEANKSDPLVAAILAGRRVDYIINTFIEGHIYSHSINGRIHCEFNQLKGDEGGTIARFCVAGDTLLETSRGIFRIDQYQPIETDTIITHLGRPRRILRKFYKGVDKMIKIVLNNGSTVKCTGNHRVLSPKGWVHARDVRVGESLFSGSINSVGEQPRIVQEDCGLLPLGQEADNERGSESNRRVCSNSDVCPSSGFTPRTFQSGESTSLFKKQDRFSKSDFWEVFGSASQLYWGNRGWRRVFDEESKRFLHSGASISNGGSSWYIRASEYSGCSPYRREQEEQRSKQLSDRNCVWASEASRCYGLSEITSIQDVGCLDVWDVEIEGDHSYLANGFIHHNSSSNPNLQNIPARDEVIGPLIRSLFLPETGEKWVRDDWSQIEYRLLAHYANGEGSNEARSAYNSDPKTDFHKMCAGFLGVDPEDKIARKRVKNVNFLSVYGGGVDKLAVTFGCSVEEATEFATLYHKKLPFVKKTGERASKTAAQKGFVTTILGRRQRFPLWEPPGNWKRDHVPLPRDEAIKAHGTNLARAYTYAALNRVLQGGAADLMKKSLVDMHDAGVFDVIGPPLVIVHDEFGNSVSFENKQHQQAIQEVQNVMQNSIKFRVPILAEREVGDSWGNCK